MCRHAAFYEQIGADLEVVKWVRDGYELKLKRWPQASVTKDNRSALEDPDFVWHELRRLVKLGVMSEVDERPHVVNALSVVYSNKKRLVWDVRELNELIDVEKLTLESLDDAAELLEENFYGATFDLEAVYFQVGLAEEQKTLLGCAFENPDTGRTTYHHDLRREKRSPQFHKTPKTCSQACKTARPEGNNLRGRLRAHRQEQRQLCQEQADPEERGKSGRVAVQRGQGARTQHGHQVPRLQPQHGQHEV